MTIRLRMKRLGQLGADRLDEIESLPRKAAIIVGLASKMAIGSRALVDRAGELEMLPDAARAQIHDLVQSLLKLALGDAASPPGPHRAREAGIRRSRRRPAVRIYRRARRRPHS